MKARALVEAESAKSAMHAVKKAQRWTVKPMPYKTTQAVVSDHMADFYFDGVKDQTLGILPTSRPDRCQMVQECLAWLFERLPFYPDGGWLPQVWLAEAEERDLLNDYYELTGVRVAQSGKTGIAVYTGGEVGRSET